MITTFPLKDFTCQGTGIPWILRSDCHLHIQSPPVFFIFSSRNIFLERLKFSAHICSLPDTYRFYLSHLLLPFKAFPFLILSFIEHSLVRPHRLIFLFNQQLCIIDAETQRASQFLFPLLPSTYCPCLSLFHLWKRF